MLSSLFFYNVAPTPEVYTLSLHDALPISKRDKAARAGDGLPEVLRVDPSRPALDRKQQQTPAPGPYSRDRKSTRLNSSHANISYAVFCLKKKMNTRKNSFTNQKHQP